MTENPKARYGRAKPPASTVPRSVVAELGVAMLEGALKYGRHNYRAADSAASIYYDAAMRHLESWWDCGEDIDPDSGLHHVTKAIASLAVLRDSMIQGRLVDDRPPSSVAFYQRLADACEQLQARYGDREPTHHSINGETK